MPDSGVLHEVMRVARELHRLEWNMWVMERDLGARIDRVEGRLDAAETRMKGRPLAPRALVWARLIWPLAWKAAAILLLLEADFSAVEIRSLLSMLAR